MLLWLKPFLELVYSCPRTLRELSLILQSPPIGRTDGQTYAHTELPTLCTSWGPDDALGHFQKWNPSKGECSPPRGHSKERTGGWPLQSAARPYRHPFHTDESAQIRQLEGWRNTPIKKPT